MTTSLRRAQLTLEIDIPAAEQPTFRAADGTDVPVPALVVTWERGTAVDSALSWHWFPVVASAHIPAGLSTSRTQWRGGALGRDGSAPQWVRDAVAAHRPPDDGELELKLKVLVNMADRAPNLTGFVATGDLRELLDNWAVRP